MLNAIAFVMMSNLTLGMDYWALAVPRFIQGFGQGFVFVPLQTLALATIRMERLSNATAAYNVVRNFGGSIGIALVTTLLARRSQYHQSTLGAHVTIWSADTAGRLHAVDATTSSARASTPSPPQRRALAMLYRDAAGPGAGPRLRRRLHPAGRALHRPAVPDSLDASRASDQTGPASSEAKGRVEPLPEPVAE